MAKSKHQKEAAQFIKWLNDDPQGVDLLVKQGSDYPASSKGQSALSTAPDYFSNQPDFYQTAAQIAAGARGFTFGPNVNAAYNAYKDAFGKVIQSKGDFTTALGAMQSATVADLQKSGFKVG
jgi:multiple sugar transport system substrate-binding protein